ncbi:dihydrofolate reductase [Entomoplasma ellychniae]|uniref:dihydrofolate reductase n=1 Tax=Entomoplasma ellychniae TaxID=2114 RepID=A0A8E2UDW5_9MOLU|nr:dihydrofolate reductase [Entomoplasma ellychniae]PPE04503.1 dihydrofolate reductase [Entomoplasma ellychniae]
MIKLIWAQTKSGVIGKDAKLPWNIPEEMKHFKKTTINSSVLMGRKTFTSMNNKKLLNRINYVLTKNLDSYKDNQDGLFFINNVDSLIEKYQTNEKDLYVIGGNSVFSKMIDFADELIRTIIKDEYEGNVYMDEVNLTKFDKINIVEYKDFYIEYFTRRKDDN